MATDAEIRAAGLKYIPQQKYLQNPYELPIAPVPTVEGGGITNTNAFTNRTLNSAITTISKTGYDGIELVVDSPHCFFCIRYSPVT